MARSDNSIETWPKMFNTGFRRKAAGLAVTIFKSQTEQLKMQTSEQVINAVTMTRSIHHDNLVQLPMIGTGELV